MAFDAVKSEASYYPTKTTRTLIGQDDYARFVERRFWSMSWSRNNWHQRTQRTFPLWDVFRPWLLEGENFDKAVRFPTLRDTARALTDEVMKNPPRAELEARNGEKPHRAQALQFKVRDRQRDTYEQIVQEECINDMIVYGEGFRLSGYYDVRFFDKKKEREIQTMNDVATERINPFHVYLDPHGRYIYEPLKKNCKRDAIIKYQYPHSTFMDLFKEIPNITNLDVVQPFEQKLTGEFVIPTTSEIEEKDLTGTRNVVNVYVRWDQQEQSYGMVANGVTVLQPEVIPNDHRRIPLTNYKFERRQDEVFYGNSLAELIAPHIYTQDTIFNLELMGLKLDLMPATMIDSDLGYNRKVHKLHPRAVWQMNVPQGKTLANSVSPFQRAQRDTNGFVNMNQMIESNMNITTGIDRRSLFLQPNELATQTAFKNQATQKRVNRIVFSNELLAESNLVELMTSDIRQYLGGKVDVMVKGQQTQRFRRVKVEGYHVIQNNEGDAEFVPSQGNKSTFELTTDAIDTDVDVVVRNMREKALLQENKVKRLLEFMPLITNMVSALGEQFPEIVQIPDFVGIIEQVAENMDLDLSRTIKNMDRADVDQIQREHQAMQLSMNVPVPQDESYTKSLAHKRQHEMLRWIFRSGRMTNEETATWKAMSEGAMKSWNDHYVATLLNLKAKILTEVQTQQAAATEPAIPGAVPGQPAPVGVVPQVKSQEVSTPAETATAKTLLRP